MQKKSMDGNTAAAYVAYAFSEVCAIYPITPSSPMGELADEWAANGKNNIFKKIPIITEMQSEAGAAGALHGALSKGAFCSTFTSSQGLLLMIPNMYKIAGELMPCVFHVASRSLARHALSIFGDHQDICAARSTGCAFLCSNSVQEVMDLSLVAHLATIRSSIPFVHFFDGFRTSHEIQKIEMIPYEVMEKYIDRKMIKQHRDRSLNPHTPHIRGTAQNPDVYFQGIEAANKYYEKLPFIVEEEMEKIFQITKRRYNLFDYIGAKDAKKVIVMMGSGAETAQEVVEFLNKEKIGLIKVRLFRPFSKNHFLQAVPKTVVEIKVLDRTKEESLPLYLDVVEAFYSSGRMVKISSGIYGLGSKEFTPSMVKAVFDTDKSNFTVGIKDDVTNRSLDIKEEIDTEDREMIRCKFWGLGGDGTVGANKQAIKIIGDNSKKHVQGYFSYDSKKSFGLTVSHLRFGDKKILSTYLIQHADYIACHHPSYVKKYDVIEGLAERGIFVLNSPWDQEEMEKNLPNSLKKMLSQKNISFYNIDAFSLAKELGLGMKINIIMQAVFFYLIKILPFKDVLQYLYKSIEEAYGKKGEEIVEKNKKALNASIERLQKIEIPNHWKDLEIEKKEDEKPDFIKDIVEEINRSKGDDLPVSSFKAGGIFPLQTTRYEKRGFATYVPKWIAENCIQCNRCAFVCPHAVIRSFLMTKEEMLKAPNYNGKKALGTKEDLFFSIEISNLDCTGCGNCVVICPAKNKALEMHKREELEGQQERFDYAEKLPEKSIMNKYTVKGSQFKKPLFEFSGACAGCGETPYLKLLTQLFPSIIIANATGCSSIFGASVPSIPWALGEKGCGPAWANSLFEDNAEYGLGMHLAILSRKKEMMDLLSKAEEENIDQKVKELLKKLKEDKDDFDMSWELSKEIIEKIKEDKNPILQKIYEKKDLLAKNSVWIIGGDGWAYDIGYGGLDHVIALGLDVNILVLDTEVYSNTGGQASKATPMGSVAKFAFGGKKTMKKNLGLMMMHYKNVYVASCALGADQNQVIKAFKEAESYKGPSIIIAYASCISHGIKKGMMQSHEEEKRAVEVGYWFNYRYDPRLEIPFCLDSKEPSFEVEKFLDGEVRYEYLKKKDPKEAKRLQEGLIQHLKEKYQELLGYSKKKS